MRYSRVMVSVFVDKIKQGGPRWIDDGRWRWIDDGRPRWVVFGPCKFDTHGDDKFSLQQGFEVIEKIAVESGAVGGWISLWSGRGGPHSAHAISFTVCHGKNIIIRNTWDKTHTLENVRDPSKKFESFFNYFDSMLDFGLLIPPDV